MMEKIKEYLQLFAALIIVVFAIFPAYGSDTSLSIDDMSAVIKNPKKYDGR